jgi:hypothetical protein
MKDATDGRDSGLFERVIGLPQDTYGNLVIGSQAVGFVKIPVDLFEEGVYGFVGTGFVGASFDGAGFGGAGFGGRDQRRPLLRQRLLSKRQGGHQHGKQQQHNLDGSR